MNEELKLKIKNTNHLRLNSADKEIVKEYTNFLPEDATFQERYYYIRNDIREQLRCPICGKPRRFNSKKTEMKKYCSKECNIADQKNISKRTADKLEKLTGKRIYLQVDGIKEKSINTLLKKYGVDNAMKNKDIAKKSYNSRKDKFIEISEKSRKTYKERTGYSSTFKNPDVISKSKNTLLKKYGVDNAMKIKKIANRISEINSNKSYNDEDSKWRFFATELCEFLTTENEFKGCDGITPYLFRCKKCKKEFTKPIRHSINTFIKCEDCYPSYVSGIESLVRDFIHSNYKGEIILNYRDVYELDIFLPELNIGIEVDGLYWHSTVNRDKNYHLLKMKYFNEKGIRVINIFEDELIYKKELCLNKLGHILGFRTNLPKIYARKCIVKPISSSEKDLFLKTNHIQGTDKSSIKLGLFYNDLLVSVMTFSKTRKALGSDGSSYELVRFANNNDYLVLGSFGKLLTYVKNNYELTRIITYADLRWSDGNLYEKNNFVKLHTSLPSYWYFKNHELVRYHRFTFTKQKILKDHPEFLNMDLTEKEMMKKLGYLSIYDCGNIVYEYKLK